MRTGAPSLQRASTGHGKIPWMGAGTGFFRDIRTRRRCSLRRRFILDIYAILARMIRRLPPLVMLMFAPLAVADSVRTLSADDWARPRSGDSLGQMPALQGTVREYLGETGREGRRIVIRHPPGEEGVLWAEELRGWLVALGVPSADIAVDSESTRVDAIELAVEEGND